MRNGQLKPAYNVQISTNNQFIASYSLHQKPTDTTTLKAHLTQHIKNLKIKPASITADAGYGSEENYQWLERKRITAYVKDRDFDRNQRPHSKSKNPYSNDKFNYDALKDRIICPAGKSMKNSGVRQRVTATGYKQEVTKYQTNKCNGCPLQRQCNKGTSIKTIELNHNLNRLKDKANKRLKTKKGIKKRKQRCHDVEPVFGAIKYNHHFKRFMLRGIDKVTVEMGLLALAHNLRKKAA